RAEGLDDAAVALAEHELVDHGVDARDELPRIGEGAEDVARAALVVVHDGAVLAERGVEQAVGLGPSRLDVLEDHRAAEVGQLVAHHDEVEAALALVEAVAAVDGRLDLPVLALDERAERLD